MSVFCIKYKVNILRQLFFFFFNKPWKHVSEKLSWYGFYRSHFNFLISSSELPNPSSVFTERLLEYSPNTHPLWHCPLKDYTHLCFPIWGWENGPNTNWQLLQQCPTHTMVAASWWIHLVLSSNNKISMRAVFWDKNNLYFLGCFICMNSHFPLIMSCM